MPERITVGSSLHTIDAPIVLGATKVLIGNEITALDVAATIKGTLALPAGGWVYAIIAPEVERVKIGRTRNPWRRVMHHINDPLPAVECLLHSVTLHANAAGHERAFHERFEHARCGRTEWFDMRDDEVAWWLGDRETEVLANCIYWHDRERRVAAQGKTDRLAEALRRYRERER